jgi:RND family efflux transporter MFP subunit
LSQSDTSNDPKRADRRDPAGAPFDGYDDVAEGIEYPHEHPPVPASHMKGTGRRLAASAVLLAIALGGAFFYVSLIKARDFELLSEATAARAAEPPAVEAVPVEATPAGQALVLPAEARGWYTSTIFARVSGYVTTWLADIGDHVKKNQVLAVIDTPELDAQLDAAKAQIMAAEAEMKVSEADAEFAKTTYNRWIGAAKGVVSDQEREDKKAGYASAKAKLNAAQARVDLDKSNVDRLTYMTQFKQVTAPYDGVITDRRIDIGDLVTAGSTSNTAPLFGIVQTDRIRVFANVPQTASLDLEAGTPADIFTEGLTTKIFEGKISRTTQSISKEARTLRVEVDIPNPTGKVLPGMYLQIAFHLKPKNWVQIPASALLFRTSGPQVAVVQPDDTIKFEDVIIGRDNGATVDIASGLPEGARVALNISNQIAEGSKVTVRPSDKVAAK